MPDILNLVNDTSMKNLLEGTFRKIERFRKLSYTVQVLWECKSRQQLATNPEMKDFISRLGHDTPLEPRHGLFRGRTNVVCLYREVAGEEKFHHVDFTSLYPSTYKYCEVPLGHPGIPSSEAMVDRSPNDFFGVTVTWPVILSMFICSTYKEFV